MKTTATIDDLFDAFVLETVQEALASDIGDDHVSRELSMESADGARRTVRVTVQSG